jgi:hypothetical protein
LPGVSNELTFLYILGPHGPLPRISRPKKGPG